jgi:prepilin-type processing-associated H-X9-DG protein
MEASEGRLLPYLGGGRAVLTCPSGVPARPPGTPPSGAPASYPPYPFSYSVNVRFTGCTRAGKFDGSVGWALAPCKLSQVVRASEKALVIEEDSVGISDGAWWSMALDSVNLRWWLTSVRHDRGKGRDGGGGLTPGYYSGPGRGNVVFADGHCEFMERRVLDSRTYVEPAYREGVY